MLNKGYLQSGFWTEGLRKIQTSKNFSILAPVVGLLSLIWCYFYIKKSTLPAKIDGPKSFTLISFVLRNPRIFWTTYMLDLCKKYSKIIQLGWRSPIYVINDVLLLKELFMSNEIINHQSSGTLIYHSERLPTTKSLIAIRDDEWKRRRKAMGHSFTSTKILGFVEIFEKKTNVLVEVLSQVANKEVKIDLRQYLSKLTADVLGETVFGVSFDSLRDPSNSLSKAVDSSLSPGPAAALMLLPYWYMMPVKSLQKFISGINTLTDLCRQIVTNRMNTSTKSNDLLQTLIDSGLDLNEAIIPESLLFLVAGHETTANLLSWAITLVSQNPDIEQNIIEEIDRVIGTNQVTSDNVDGLEYLECVINESLRLYPPALITERQTEVPVKLGGIQFPKKTQFFVPIWATHHNEKYWANPEQFDPTRFDSAHKDKIVPFSFLPFGGGSRICIGWKFSLTEAKVALATIYKNFQFTLKEEVKPATTGNLLRPESVMVTVKHRIS